MRTIIFLTFAIAALAASSWDSTIMITVSTSAAASACTVHSCPDITCTATTTLQAVSETSETGSVYEVLLWLADSTTWASTWSYTSGVTNLTVTGNLDLGVMTFDAPTAHDPATEVNPTCTLTVYSKCTYSSSAGTPSTIGSTGTSWFTAAVDSAAVTDNATPANNMWVFDLTLATAGKLDGASFADIEDSSTAIELYYYDTGAWGTALTLTTGWNALASPDIYGTVTFSTNAMVGNVSITSTATSGDLTTWEALDGCVTGTASSSRRDSILAAAFALSFF